jgi:hypothetical protein
VKRLTTALAATVLLTGCGVSQLASKAASSPTPTSFTIKGTMTVKSGEGSDPNMGKSCITDGGYADISTGTQVTVKNGTGKVLALGSLGPGSTSDWLTLPTFDPETGSIESRPQATKCRFAFSVPNVPEGEDFYAVEVSHRGEVRYSRSDLNTSVTLRL